MTSSCDGWSSAYLVWSASSSVHVRAVPNVFHGNCLHRSLSVCQNDSFRCNQWRKFCQNDISPFHKTCNHWLFYPYQCLLLSGFKQVTWSRGDNYGHLFQHLEICLPETVGTPETGVSLGWPVGAVGTATQSQCTQDKMADMFADDIFECFFLNENIWISIKISPNFVPKVPINKIPALVQIMAWCRSGDKPLSKPTMVRLLTHLWVTRP